MNTCEKPTTVVRQPAFTTREDEAGIHLQIALPGVSKEDVKLSVKQSTLQIEAVRSSNIPEDWKTHSSQTGDITYRFAARIVAKYDAANAKASLENGVLTLEIPVREDAKAREIYVN